MPGYATIETYVDSEKAAENIARAVMSGLPDVPTCHVEEVRSMFRWDGQLKDIREWRVSFDVPEPIVGNVTKAVSEASPYILPGIAIRPFEPETEAMRMWLEDPMSETGI